MNEGKTETITLAGGTTRHIYLSGHGRDGRRRALIVLHEAPGIDDDIRRIADRFAREGYVVAAPDLLEGRGPKPFCIARTMRALGTGGGDVLDEIEALRVHLASRDDVRPDAIGVVGFCMGGGFAILAAGTGRFQVAAPFYGFAPRDPAKLPKLCPTIASYGATDLVVRRDPAILEEHLTRAGVAHEVKTYPGVGHSFMNRHPAWMQAIGKRLPLHAAYDEGAAEDSWRRMLAFFDAQMPA